MEMEGWRGTGASHQRDRRHASLELGIQTREASYILIGKTGFNTGLVDCKSIFIFLESSCSLIRRKTSDRVILLVRSVPRGDATYPNACWLHGIFMMMLQQWGQGIWIRSDNYDEVYTWHSPGAERILSRLIIVLFLCTEVSLTNLSENIRLMSIFSYCSMYVDLYQSFAQIIKWRIIIRPTNGICIKGTNGSLSLEKYVSTKFITLLWHRIVPSLIETENSTSPCEFIVKVHLEHSINVHLSTNIILN